MWQTGLPGTLPPSPWNHSCKVTHNTPAGKRFSSVILTFYQHLALSLWNTSCPGTDPQQWPHGCPLWPSRCLSFQCPARKWPDVPGSVSQLFSIHTPQAIAPIPIVYEKCQLKSTLKPMDLLMFWIPICSRLSNVVQTSRGGVTAPEGQLPAGPFCLNSSQPCLASPGSELPWALPLPSLNLSLLLWMTSSLPDGKYLRALFTDVSLACSGHAHRGNSWLLVNGTNICPVDHHPDVVPFSKSDSSFKNIDQMTSHSSVYL